VKQTLTYCDVCGSTENIPTGAFRELRVEDKLYDLCSMCHGNIVNPLTGKGRNVPGPNTTNWDKWTKEYNRHLMESQPWTQPGCDWNSSLLKGQQR
jgi:hypothetical protein